jgi:hypothetical protein
MTVAIVDYGSGNLRSAAQAFERAAREAGTDARVVVTSSPAEVAAVLQTYSIKLTKLTDLVPNRFDRSLSELERLQSVPLLPDGQGKSGGATSDHPSSGVSPLSAVGVISIDHEELSLALEANRL